MGLRSHRTVARYLVISTVIAALFATGGAAACPDCDSSARSALLNGRFWMQVLPVWIPFLALAVIAGLLYRAAHVPSTRAARRRFVRTTLP